MSTQSHLTREQRIDLLKKVAAGEATPEALRPRHLVLKIFSARRGMQNGLYKNGILTDDPVDKAEFWNAFAEKKVKVRRVDLDDDNG